MQALQKRLLDYSGGLMSDPSAGLAPMKQTAADQINRNYAAAPGAISRQMASRGYGSSGNMGNSMYSLENSRLGDMSGLESQFAQMALNQRNQGATIGENLLQMGRGTQTTGTSPDTSAANGFGSAAGSLSNISTMLMMSKLLGGGGGNSYTPSAIDPSKLP